MEPSNLLAVRAQLRAVLEEEVAALEAREAEVRERYESLSEPINLYRSWRVEW